LRVVNCHDFEPGWSWIAPLYRGPPEIEWRSVDTLRSRLVRKLPGPHLGRLRAALEVRSILARHQADLLVSHGNSNGASQLEGIIKTHAQPPFPNGAPPWYVQFSAAVQTNIHQAVTGQETVAQAVQAIANQVNTLKSSG